MKNKFLAFLVFVLWAEVADAQFLQDTVKVKQVNVTENQKNNQTGFSQILLDSIQLTRHQNESLATLLASESSLYIKSYGQGQLASSSFRGASASHTATLWNGVDIRSPMLGQVDFSVIPVFFADKVELSIGSAALSEADGALGGAINLVSKAHWNSAPKVRVQTLYNGVKNWQNMFEFVIGSTNFSSKTKFLYENSHNLYPFLNKTLLEPFRDIRKNAGFNTQAVLQELSFRKNRGILELKVWIQENDRKLPGSIFSGNIQREESMKARALRSIAQYKVYFQNQNRLVFSSSHLYDKLNYVQKLGQNITNIQSDNEIQTYNNFIDFQINTSTNWKSQLKISYQHVRVQTNNYQQNVVQNRTVFIAQTEYIPNSKLNINLNSKIGKTDQQNGYVLGALAVKYRPLNDLPVSILASVSRNYHQPTLNDLYWTPGGNPNLTNEKGFTYDCGIHYQFTKFDRILDLKIGFFDAYIDNWIMWLPQNAIYWSPVNIKKVRNRGVELNMKQKYLFEHFKLDLNVNYSYTKATNMSAISDWDTSVGKQLVYTPEHILSVSSSIDYKFIQISMSTQTMSKRYTRTDNLSALPDYQIVDVKITASLFKKRASVGFTVDNLLNKDYESVANYPMPLRVVGGIITFQTGMARANSFGHTRVDYE